MSAKSIRDIPVYDETQFKQLSPEEQAQHEQRLGEAAENFINDQMRSSTDTEMFASNQHDRR